AIPVNTAWSVADNLIKYGYVPGRMIMSLKGVSLEDNYGDYVLSYGNCIVVTAADDDSPFKVGDIITDVGGVSVSSVSELQKALRAYSSGDSVQIKVTRRYNEGFFTYSRSGYVSATVVGTESGNP
ncbi:MAG: PDZ domain-containing protein, partial [Clostridia bacterium]|nr:PDZ domain-containing protein [Clostridia bacterium]